MVAASVKTHVEDVKERSRLTKEEWREFTKTVWQIANVTSGYHPAVFPLEIPARLIKMFTFVEEVVLDPFAGLGTTATAAIQLGRRAICVDQNRSYVTRIVREHRDAYRSARLRAVTADSRRLDILSDNSVDLVVTSPPYWNKANYGKKTANLGNIRSYAGFLQEMKIVFSELLRVLRPGRKLCVVTANVNQHTNHGLLAFPLPADFTILLRSLGFLFINEILWSKNGTGGRWGSWGVQRPIFGSYPYPPNFLFKNVHEHILIVAKPTSKRVNGPKVVSYHEIMNVGTGSSG